MPSNRTCPRIQRLPATHLKLIERAVLIEEIRYSHSTDSESLFHWVDVVGGMAGCVVKMLLACALQRISLSLCVGVCVLCVCGVYSKPRLDNE